MKGAPPLATARSRQRQSRPRSLGDQFSFVLRQRREDAEDELARRSRGVDRGALTGEHLQSDAALGQFVNGVDQVAQIATQPVQLPDHQRVPFAQGFAQRV